MTELFVKSKEFASLMDQNRYVEAGEYLNSNCSYYFRDKVIEGKDAILKEYTGNYEAGVKKLDEIQFTSEIETDTADRYRIKYFDRIRKGDIWHEHRCEQLITFEHGFIKRIEHIDLPGEDDTLQAFYRKVGLK